MSATAGYPAAYQAVVHAYEEAARKYHMVSASNKSTEGIRSAYGFLKMTQARWHMSKTEFKRYSSHLRRVDACLDAIQTLRGTQADSARGALHRLRAAMQLAYFKMFDYDNNGFIDRDEMTRYLTYKFRMVYEADAGMVQRMGATYDVLAEVTAEQAFQEAQPAIENYMRLDEFNAWYASSDGAVVFLKAGGRFDRVPSWLKRRLAVLNSKLESIKLSFRW